MSAAEYRALRQINDHLEGMARRAGANATDDWRLAVMRGRAAARVEAAAAALAGSAAAPDASPELLAVAAMVRSGAVTWQECLLGKVDHLPEVRAWAGDAPEPPVTRGDDDGDITDLLYSDF